MAESGALHFVKRVGTAIVLIPLVLVLVLRGPVPVLATVAGIVALLTTREFLQLSEGYGIQPQRLPAYIYAGIFFALLAIPVYHSGELTTAVFGCGAALFAALAPFVFLTIAMRRESLRGAFPAAVVSATAFAYIALPLACLVQLRQHWRGAFFVLYLLLVVWAGDIFAYFVGRSLGRHLMSPRISPKKTWEGAIASVTASVIVGTLLFDHARGISQFLLNWRLIEQSGGIFALDRPPLLPIVLLSVGINIAAQLGDLVESLVKRGAGVKDSGALLPG
ncbi:MAG TPA: phosphatidate cytidylyltransferase, partial [Terriglobales bacterium]